MEYINTNYLAKLNLRIGTIKAVKKHPKLDDYIILIDLGIAERDMQIVADLKASYKIQELIGKQAVFLENLKPTVIKGIESQGALFITQLEGKPVLVMPDKKVLPGVRVCGIQDSKVCYTK